LSDYGDIIERMFEVGDRSGDEWTIRCPRHEDNRPSLRVNVRKGVFMCLSCQWKGQIKDLIGDVPEPEPEVADIYRVLNGLDEDTVGPRTLPESVLRRYRFPTDYWTGRGFDRATITAWDLGYDPLADDAIIPIRTASGDLSGVIRRRLTEGYDGPKYKHPKGFSKKHSLFGSWLVSGDHVVITEGPLDAVKVWQAGYDAVAQYGSSLADEQVDVLRGLGVYRVTLFYDNDRAGKMAARQAMDALPDFLVATVSYRRSPYKDPGEMPEDVIANVIEDAEVRLGGTR